MQLRDYVIRRLIILPFLIIGVSIVVFSLTRIGGSPIGIYLVARDDAGRGGADRGALSPR